MFWQRRQTSRGGVWVASHPVPGTLSSPHFPLFAGHLNGISSSLGNLALSCHTGVIHETGKACYLGEKYRVPLSRVLITEPTGQGCIPSFGLRSEGALDEY